MSRIPFQAVALFLTKWWSKYISVVDREAVLKDVYMVTIVQDSAVVP